MSRTFYEFLEDNRQKPCRNPKCNATRDRISGFCRACGFSYQKWGSAQHNHRNFYRRNYIGEVEEVSAIIEHNLDIVSPPHPLIERCVSILDGMLTKASLGKSPSPHDQFSRDTIRLVGRIADAGVTGRQVLVEASALYLLWVTRPSNFDTTQRDGLNHFKCVVGNQVLRLVPYNKCLIRKHVKFPVGDFIYRHTGKALVSISKAVEKRERLRQEYAKKHSAPLEVPIP